MHNVRDFSDQLTSCNKEFTVLVVRTAAVIRLYLAWGISAIRFLKISLKYRFIIQLRFL